MSSSPPVQSRAPSDRRPVAWWVPMIVAAVVALVVSLVPGGGLLAQSDAGSEEDQQEQDQQEEETDAEVEEEAQERAENPLKPLDTASPQATYVSFLTQIKLAEELLVQYEADRSKEHQEELSDEFARTSDLFDLNEVSSVNRSKAVVGGFVNLADILNRIPPLDIEEIPDEDDVAEAESQEVTIPASGEQIDAPARGITSFTLPDTEIVIVRIEDGDGAGGYVFSTDTLAALPGFREQVADLPVNEGVVVDDWVKVELEFTGHLLPRRLIDSLPDWFDNEFLGSPIWKSLADLLVFAIVGGLAVMSYRLLGRRGNPGTVGGYVYRLATPVLLLVMTTYARQFMNEQINHNGYVATIANLVATAVVWFCLAWIFWLATKLIVEWFIASPRISDDSVDAHLLRLLGKVVSAIGAFTFLLVGLERLGVPTIGLGLGAGVFGLAVALAATSTLENLLGGITVYIDKPFQVDDVIVVDGDIGVVENIGPRSTRIRKFDDTRVTMPNSDVSRAKITNLSERRDILFEHVIGVRYETTVEQLQQIVAAIDAQLRNHYMVLDEADFPRVRVAEFGSSSIDIDVRAHVATDDRHVFMAIQQELLLLIFQIVEAAGSGFAFPSTTTYLAEDTGLQSPTDSELLDVPPMVPRVYTPLASLESDVGRAGEPVVDVESAADGDGD